MFLDFIIIINVPINMILYDIFFFITPKLGNWDGITSNEGDGKLETKNIA